MIISTEDVEFYVGIMRQLIEKKFRENATIVRQLKPDDLVKMMKFLGEAFRSEDPKSYTLPGQNEWDSGAGIQVGSAQKHNKELREVIDILRLEITRIRENENVVLLAGSPKPKT